MISGIAAYCTPVPGLGEARAAQLMAGAGRNVLARAAVRGGVGAAQGAFGTVLEQPLDVWSYSQDGRDYTFADALSGIAGNAGIGGVLHAGGGAAADVWRGFHGRQVYPFAEGEPYARAPGAPPSILPTDTGASFPPPPAPPLTPGEFPQVDTLLAHPEVAGRTAHPRYGFNVSDVLNDRGIADAIENPQIERSQDVSSGALASETGGTFVDRSIPAEATVGGVTFDPAVPLNVAAHVRRGTLERLLAQYRRENGEEPDEATFENIVAYADKHYATPAEKAWVTSRGIDWEKYQEAKQGWHPAFRPPPAPERIPPGAATWANEHFELPIEVANEAPTRFPDGRFYQRARHEGQEVFVPVEEIKPAASAGPYATPAETRAADILSKGPQYRIDHAIDTAVGNIASARNTLARPDVADWVADAKRQEIADAQERLERLIAERDAGTTERSRAPVREEAKGPGRAAISTDDQLIAKLTDDQRREFSAFAAELDRQVQDRTILRIAADIRKRQRLEALAGRTLPHPPATALDARIPPEDRARPVPGPLPNWIRSFAPGDLVVDAKRFQFKSGADENGVTERLRGVTRWDPLKAGLALVWEDRDGKFYIVDGFQRRALAARIAAEDPAQNPRLLAYVLRASNGVTDRMARTAAALKNVAEGTGTAIDAAKVLRDQPDLVDQLPPRSELVRQARGLANLADDNFKMVIDEIAPANYASIVGKLVPKDAALQRALLQVLDKTDPSNVVQAEAIVRHGIEVAGGRKGEEARLSDADEIARSLYVERAKILDLALKDLKRDKTVFKILSQERERIEEAGNTLAADINEKRQAADAAAIQVLQILAGRGGPISDALDAAARHVRDGGRREDAIRDFVAAVRGYVTSTDRPDLAHGRTGGPADAGAEDAASAVERAPEKSASARVEQETEAEIRDIVTPPVNPATGSDEILSPSESQDVLKGAIGSLIEGRPVRAAEQIEATRDESAPTKSEGKSRRTARPPPLTPRELWEKLASELLPQDEPEAVEASRAADAMTEPASVSTEPAVRARAAARLNAEVVAQYDASRAFTAEEDLFDREQFDAAMQDYDREQDRKADIVKHAAACLVSGGFTLEGGPPPAASDQETPPEEPK